MNQAMSPRCFALLPCAGSGSRAGAGQPKQYKLLAGLPLVRHTLNAFTAVSRIDHVLVVIAPDDRMWVDSGPGVSIAPCGGATRAESVLNGLGALRQLGATAADWVLVHDAARCLVTPGLIDALIDACLPDAVGGLLALPLPDTLKVATGDQRVQATLDRAAKWLGQTPQMFRLESLQTALAVHQGADFAGITDEASAMELAGHQPLLVHGSASNIKVTWPEDFELAEALLTTRLRGAAGS